jgi:hypothetical protein
LNSCEAVAWIFGEGFIYLRVLVKKSNYSSIVITVNSDAGDESYRGAWIIVEKPQMEHGNTHPMRVRKMEENERKMRELFISCADE